MIVTAVSAASVESAVESAIGGEAGAIKAVDISFRHEGKEIEPKKAVTVRLATSGMDAEAEKQVVHIDDSGNASVVKGASVNADGVANFSAKDFSIYVVVDDGEEEQESRLTVNFVQADGSTTVTMLVANKQAGNIKEYIYDPGVGTLPDGATFDGWTDVKDYDADTEAKTIADIRNEVKSKLEAGIEEGDEITYYAMVFNSYTITYLDEESVTLKNDQLRYRTDYSGDHKYTVDLPYTPYTRDDDEGATAVFTGWQLIDPQPADKTVYDNGTEIDLSQSIVLKATVSKGFWLNFNENMPAASFTDMQFIASGQHPATPKDPTCTGYTFDGWYTEDADPDERDGRVAGTKVTDFGSLDLKENTTLHAKWVANKTAKYSVLIWKQDLSGDGYDFAESVTLNGTVGNTINTVTASGSGDSRYASVNGTSKKYTGFHLKEFDQNVTIKADGTAVLNVYYDRNEVTLKFMYRRSTWSSWTEYETMTGLYGQTLESQGYTWPTEYWWYEGTTTWSTRMTFMDAFIIPDGSSSQTFYGYTDSGSHHIHFLKQKADGSGYEEADVVNSDTGSFQITDKYSGFHAAYYSTNGTSWTSVGSKSSSGTYRTVDYSRDLYIRFDRENYNILFMDGVYATDSDPERYNFSDQKLGEADKIRFGADVSSYANYTDTDLHKEMHNYVFDGWYADDKCQNKYNFTTMPEGGIVVYAKWIKKEFLVKLHNNADGDPSFHYNSAAQAEEFRRESGSNIENVGGERDYYDLVGWYTDAACTHSFDFDTFTVNETTVGSRGKIYSASEIDPAYPNTVGEINLYAKWRSKLVGTEGIRAVYDADGGSNAPTDDNLYVDDAEAIAGAASTAPTDDKVFSHWVVQKWNGSKYEDTDEEVFPGETFDVKADYAKIVDKDGNVVKREDLDDKETYTYTVQLKAEYIEKEKHSTTHVYWYKNDGTAGPIHTDPEGYPDGDKELKSNESIDILKAQSRSGYEFKGWARVSEPSDTSGYAPKDVSGTQILYYDNGKFYRDEDLKEEAKYIAADEEKPYDTLIAVWEKLDELKYDKNAADASGSMDPSTGNVGDEVDVSANSFTRKGYTFDSWNTKPDGSGTKYAAGSKYTLTKDDDVLYAQWKANSHKVTYKYTGTVPGGAPAVPAESTHDYGSSVKVADAPTMDGYVFSGWSKSGSFDMPDEDVEISGSWEKLYTVKYSYTGTVPDGAPEAPKAAEYKLGDKVPAAAVPTMEGYIFSGWSGEVSTMPAEDVEVTGSWREAEIFTITYDPNGGVFRDTSATTDIQYVEGQVIKIAEAPTREGYKFLYWKGSEYQPGDSYTVTEPHTFVAQWAKVEENADEEIDDSDSSGESKTKSSGSEKTAKSPKTGDENHLNLWFAMMLLSLAVMSGIAIAETESEKDSQSEK